MEAQDWETLQLLLNTSRVSSTTWLATHKPPRPGDKQKVLCAVQLGQPRLWFQGNRKLYFPLTRAGGGAISLGWAPIPFPARSKEVLYGGPPESFCRPKSHMYLAGIPTMPRSCWQFWGAILWTLPKWEFQCNTFVQTLPSTGPNGQKVSWDRLGEEDYGSCRTVLGRGPLGFTKFPSPQGPRDSG